MKRFLLLALALCFATPAALAHRLDEYLQASMLSIEPGTVQLTMRLVPGVAVASQVIAVIDRNGDGTLSEQEQRRYAEQVLVDLELREDGRPLKLHLLSAVFPSTSDLREGTGEVELAFAADLSGSKGHHELTLENHHRRDISVYLVNSLVPSNKSLSLSEQTRNQTQSFYSVTFAQSDSGVSSQKFTWSGFGGTFHLGMQHIAKGTDHLLFLLTLLLPAPLLATAAKWQSRASVRRTLLQTLQIVTAFTIGHSLTLALSGFGLVRLPNRPVEILIAVSIFVSAVHAIRPLFPGREALVAAFFGLIHGLAFASALNELGVSGWYRLVSLFGFNLGIEAMQLVVLTATLPALILLSFTRFYPPVRIVGAAFALLASTTWIFERISDHSSWLGDIIERFAHHGSFLAVALWTGTLFAWLSSGFHSYISEQQVSSDLQGHGAAHE